MKLLQEPFIPLLPAVTAVNTALSEGSTITRPEETITVASWFCGGCGGNRKRGRESWAFYGVGCWGIYLALGLALMEGLKFTFFA